ncbi:uncharacterized protein PG998_000538 [Apiospora kogelbergensis]|uniref:RING-type domain-containing protein n=1 Tax=Apiospora kogelbergensis TaxID=1337665 RepID=A0AAW0QX01_9PEZI
MSDDEGIFASAMGSYLGPDGYFHTDAIPFSNTGLAFAFETATNTDTDTDNNNYQSRNNSINNLPSFPDTFGSVQTSPDISHPDFPLQVPYSGYFPGFVSQYRSYAAAPTLAQPVQFPQPPPLPLPLPLPDHTFSGNNYHNNHLFCGGVGQSGPLPEVAGLDANWDANSDLNWDSSIQGYRHLSPSSAFFPRREFEPSQGQSPGQGQGQGQVQQQTQQCTCAPLRPLDSVDPQSNSPLPLHSFHHNIDISSNNSDVYHLHNHTHNHSTPTIAGPFLPPTTTQQPPPSLIDQNTSFDSLLSPNIPPAANTAPGLEPETDDFYVSALASANFSLPSLQPPPSSSPFAANRTQTEPTETSLFPQPSFGSEMPPASSSSAGLPTAPRRSRRLSQVVDLTKEESREITLSSSPVPMGPPATTATATRKRRRSSTNASASNATAAVRRTSTSTAQRPAQRRSRGSVRPPSPGESVFGESSPAPQAKEEDLEVLDLSKADEVPKELQKPAIDNRVKLSKFQCVICMDDVSNLTVTHCGHLFCSECLHSALHIDSVKKCCPVCRTKVDIRSTGRNQKSYYHLELKVMTATRKGKQPVGR